jgi:hypothetical protein
MEQRSPQGRGDRPRLGADLEDPPLGIVLHDHPARVAAEALGRFCGNACAIFDDRLAGLIGVFQDGGVHMHHDLVVLGRRAGIDAVVQCGLGQQLQSVGLLLGHRRRFRRNVRARVRGDVRGLSGWVLSPLPLIQGLTRRRQGFQQERPGFGRQATADRDGTVLGGIHVEGTAGVLPDRLVLFRLAIHAAPATDDALDMFGGAGAADRQQAFLGLRRRHPRERADLGIRELAVGECLSEPRQRGERARHAHLFAGRAQVEADTPGEPFRAGAEAVVPAAVDIELANQVQQAGGGGIEMHGELGDLVAQAIQRAQIHGESPFDAATLHRGFEAAGQAHRCAIAPLRAFSLDADVDHAAPGAHGAQEPRPQAAVVA